MDDSNSPKSTQNITDDLSILPQLDIKPGSFSNGPKSANQCIKKDRNFLSTNIDLTNQIFNPKIESRSSTFSYFPTKFHNTTQTISNNSPSQNIIIHDSPPVLNSPNQPENLSNDNSIKIDQNNLNQNELFDGTCPNNNSTETNRSELFDETRSNNNSINQKSTNSNNQKTNSSYQPQQSNNQEINNTAKSMNSKNSFVLPKNVYQGESIPEDRCRYLIKRYKNNGAVPDSTERFGLLQYLSDESFNLLISRHFSESEEMFQLRDNLARSIEIVEIEEYTKKRISSLQDEIEGTKDMIHEAQTKWDNKLYQIEKEIKEKKEKQITQQNQELSDFDDYYNDISNFIRYSKPSPQLLQILTKERKMVICKKFDDALIMKKEADKLEKKETQIAQQKAEKEIILKREKLLHKHEIEKNSLENYSSKLISSYQSYKQKELEILNRRLRLLLKIQQDVKTSGESLTSATSKTILFNEPLVVRSHQTTVSFKQFREKSVTKKLNLSPIDDLDKKCKNLCRSQAMRASLSGKSTRLVTPITSRPLSQMASSRKQKLFV